MKDRIDWATLFFVVAIIMFLYASANNNVAIGFGGLLVLMVSFILFVER